MLERLNGYLNNIMQLPGWLQLKKQGFISPGYCGLSFLPNEILIAYTVKKNGDIQLEFCKSYFYENLDDLEDTLQKIVREKKIAGVLTNYVLTNDHYQIIVTESLPVPKAEFQDAIRWKIKDAISFPIEDSIIDYVPLPKTKISGSASMIAVVVARKSYLYTVEKIIRNARLSMGAIDVPELCLRNLTALYETDDKTSALIYLEEKDSQIIVTLHQQIYFIRKLEFALENIKTMSADEFNVQLDKLSLEIQRSFDYYHTQWRNPNPTRIFLAAISNSPVNIASELEKRLALNVRAFDITEKIKCANPFSVEMQGKYLPVLGGAIRTSIKEYETTD